MTPATHTVRLVREGGRPVRARPGPIMRGPSTIASWLGDIAAREPVEVFWLIALDAQRRPIHGAPVEVTRGLLNTSLVHPREVFRAAILAGACAVVVAHNHPSGDPTPSTEDRAVTRELSAAGEILGVPVLDHIVLTADPDRWCSFLESGLFPSPT